MGVPVYTKQQFESMASRPNSSSSSSSSSSPPKCLVTLNHHKIYDLTSFLPAHPGGRDLLLEYAGQDVTEVLKDGDVHAHSETAYEMLEDEDSGWLVGVLEKEKEEGEEEEARPSTPSQRNKVRKVGEERDEDEESDDAVRETALGNKQVTTESQMYIPTNIAQDFEHHKFLDLNRPLFPQVLFARFDKKFYIEQIHKPRHYGGSKDKAGNKKGTGYRDSSAPIFGNFLEPLSKTPWWVVPLVWIPFDIYCAHLSLSTPTNTFTFTTTATFPIPLFVAFYALGLFLWTLVEYALHRFLFHIEYYLPDHPLAFTLHFLLHGVHHYLPMDNYRLVMPPAMFCILCFPIYHLCHFLFPQYNVAMAVFSGGLLGYVWYDLTHYSLHHVKLPEMMKEVKRNHLDHHYKDYDIAYGVTSNFWDKVFGTVEPKQPSRLLKTYKTK